MWITRCHTIQSPKCASLCRQDIKPLLQRLKSTSSLQDKRRLPVQRWMNTVDGVNLCGAYMRVAEVANVNNWAERDSTWIAHGRNSRWDLFNLTRRRGWPSWTGLSLRTPTGEDW